VTEELLAKFLADLQNESDSSSGKVQSSDDKKPIVSVPCSSDLDIQAFITKKKEKNQRRKGSSDEGNVNENINFDDDDCDAALLMCDDADTNKITIPVSFEDLEEVAKNEISEDEKRRSKLSEIYKSALMDSEGNMCTSPPDEVVRDELDTRGGNIVFPGQIEEEEHVIPRRKRTILEFKVVSSKACTNPSKVNYRKVKFSLYNHV